MLANRLHVFRASWTLIDQGIVSLGTFLINIQLARSLPQAEYGVFALLFGAMLTLQIFNSSLLLYPLSIRLPVAKGEDHARLLSAGMALVIFQTLPLALILIAGLVFFGRADLVLPAFASFVLWQTQEAMRRGLLADFRHATAVVGDSLSYLGQVVALFFMARWGSLSVETALYAMAVTSGIAAILQAYQLKVSWLKLARNISGEVWGVGREFVSVGIWSLANNLVSMLRMQALPWVLALTQGAAAAAGFQAALNLVNLVNPVIIGLCNVIPQTAASAQSKGNLNAWRAARVYILMGIPPTFGYYALALMFPAFILRIFYGAGSPYVDLTVAVQLLVVAWMAGYLTDMVASFLHGVDKARLALAINLLGAIAAIILAVPLITMYGLTGSCLALVGANFVRLVASQLTLSRVKNDERLA